MLLALLIATSLGDRIAARAQAAAGLESVHELSAHANDDCSGFVRVVYGREGVDLAALPPRPGENGVSNIRRLAGPLHRRPRTGDLVFFRDTTGRRGLTHIGVVDSVGPGWRATFVHRSGSGIVRSRLDLRHPRSRATNDYIRKQPRKLAGELVAGFASPDPLLARPAARTPRRSLSRGRARRT